MLSLSLRRNLGGLITNAESKFSGGAFLSLTTTHSFLGQAANDGIFSSVLAQAVITAIRDEYYVACRIQFTTPDHTLAS
ncbi:hypothetical protein ANO14919_002180 [Xylariales sp. No.14919]|nr:hypothetical protein ANO14919_002180 [Xylariales sp. No.14919]